MKLADIARAAQSQNQGPVEEDGRWFDRIASRRARLHQCLAGFDHDIEAMTEYCFAVGIRHPHRAVGYLMFVVNAFGPNDDPIWPSQAREIRMRAGRIVERSVPLPAAAAEYVKEEERR